MDITVNVNGEIGEEGDNMKVFDNGHSQLYQSNALDLPIEDETIDCVVTSPPYWGIRDYGVDGQIGLEETPEKFLDNMVNVFREVKRVLKPTGTVWMNLGDVYASGGGTGAANNSVSEGSQVLPSFRSSRYLGSANPRTAVGDIKTKDLVGIPWMVAFALRADGWYLRADIIWSKPNPMPESVQDRPTKAHEYVFLLTKSPKYYYDVDAIRERTGNEATQEEWSNSKGRHAPGGNLTEGVNAGFGSKQESLTHPNGRNKRSVWEINTQAYSDAHFATYPEKLVEPCVLAGSPLGGTVLDPFAGSGTTLAVAQRLGRKAIGTDISSEYLALASKRLEKVALPMMLGI